ncbi:MAG: tetratricopeptide repeat protein, partial [Acidobacteria bacterium]|nr:tetratricopeptide repeat protein [Acidobacteriota bacterium]
RRVVVRGNTPFDVLLETAKQALNASPPNYARAEAAYRHALRMHPKEVRAHEGLGEVYAAQGLYEKAAEVYEGLVRIKPKRPESHFKLGELYNRVGRKDDALAEVTALRELKKNGLADKLAALIGGN